MRQYQMRLKETKETKKVFCNKCGKEIPVVDGHTEEEVFSVDYRWGYFSGKDGERHRFDLCEDCYDEMLHAFRIPAEIEE